MKTTLAALKFAALSTLIALTFTPASVEAARERAIYVRFTILQESNGIGNEIFVKNNNYINAVLARINSHYYKMNNVELVFGSKRVIKDSRLYHTAMYDGRGPLIDRFRRQGNTGEIHVVVTRQEKIDVNGVATGVHFDYSPTMLIRTVVNGTDPKKLDFVGGVRSVNVTAGLFVHELGHMMDLTHNGAVNTENYTKDANARGVALYKRYLSRLAGYHHRFVNTGGEVTPPTPPRRPITPAVQGRSSLRGGGSGGGGGIRRDFSGSLYRRH